MKVIKLLVSVLALTSSADAAVSHLAPEHRALLLHQGVFRVAAMSQIPPGIVSLCADSNGRMAAAGERWEATDVFDGSLPRKRIVWAAAHKNLYLLHYERGGIAHSFHIVLAKVGSDGKAVLVWRAVAGRYSDINAFTQALSENHMDDDPKYAY